MKVYRVEGPFFFLCVHIVPVLKTRQEIQQARIYSKSMVSFNTGGGTAAKPATTTSSAAAKKKTPKSSKTPTFKGDAKAESILHQKVITNGSRQSGQIIALETALSSYVGEKLYPDWAESIRNNLRKSNTDYMPPIVNRSNYGQLNLAGDAFVWNGATPLAQMDEEDCFNRDKSLWDSNSKVGINNWNRKKEKFIVYSF